MAAMAASPDGSLQPSHSEPSIFQGSNGTFHISNPGKPVEVNGIDILAEIGRLKISNTNMMDRIATLEARHTTSSNCACNDSMGFKFFEDSTYFGEITGCDLTTFKNVSVLVGNISISGCTELDLSLFEKLVAVQGFIAIEGNTLVGTGAFPQLSSVEGHLSLKDNLGAVAGSGTFSHLRSVGGLLRIRNNRDMLSLDGLANVESVGALVIRDNANLALIALNALQSVGKDDTSTGYLMLQSNGKLTKVSGFANLTVVHGDLQVYDHIALSAIDGFARLTTIRKSLDIYNNVVLQNVDGLKSLISVGGFVRVCHNILSPMPTFLREVAKSADTSDPRQCLSEASPGTTDACISMCLPPLP